MGGWILSGARRSGSRSGDKHTRGGGNVTSDRSDETRLWRQVVDALPDGVMLVDEEGKALAVNQALEGIAERAEVHGASCCELFGCHHPGGDLEGRSEERRVGKECRSRWSPYH